MNLQKEKIHVTGMHCSGCADRVTQVLENIDGINSADVSLEDEQAEVTFDQDQTAFFDMKEAIEQAGYQAEKQ